MAFAGWHSTITDLHGNVVPKVQVTVRDEVTGALAVLYTDREGMTGRGNPFLADDQGFAAFHVAGGAYRIVARSGAYEREWRYVGIGTAQETDIEELGDFLQAGVVPFSTKAALLAFMPEEGTNVGGAVWADPVGTNNGYYIWSSTSWSFARPLPDTFGRLYVTGGTVNAVQTTLDTGINPSAPTVFFIDVLAPNTAAVTLAINGANQGEVLNAAGHSLAAGEWQGRIFLTREAEGHYRIVNDPASALSAAQSATAADQARAASVTAKSQSETAKDQSVTAKNQSETAQQGSETARDQSVTAKDQSETARNESVTARNESVAAKESSGQSAVSSASSASSSAGSASAASGHASAANTSKNEAAISAGTATTQANRSKDEADRAEAAANSIDMPVTYLPQTRTPAQQAQARQNIAADQTNMATVGAALAAPTPKATIADGDKFGGVLSGGAVLATWSWATVKASIKLFTDTLYATVAQGAKADSAVQPAVMNTALEAKQDNLGYTPVNKAGGTMDADPTDPLGVATKQYVDENSSGIGIDQTWKNVTSSRARNTIYQNTTGQPIFVNINTSSYNARIQVSPNGTTGWIAITGTEGGGTRAAIIPNDMYYRLNQAETNTINTWAELS